MLCILCQVSEVTETESPIRVQLLQAAAQLVAEHGPDALTTRRLAGEVGTSTMAVYTHFGGMPNLLNALYREAFERFARRLGDVPRTDDPLFDARQLIAAYRRFALDNPHFYAIMFGNSRLEFSPNLEDLTFALGTFEVLVDAVQRCVDAGLMSGPALDAGYQVWSALHGAVSLELVMPPDVMSPLTSGEVYGQLVGTVLKGLMKATPGD
jgi:AcrR family transcriptional regulator